MYDQMFSLFFSYRPLSASCCYLMPLERCGSNMQHGQPRELFKWIWVIWTYSQVCRVFVQVQWGLLGQDVEPAVQGEVKSCQVGRSTRGADQCGDFTLVLFSAHTQRSRRSGWCAAVALHCGVEEGKEVESHFLWTKFRSFSSSSLTLCLLSQDRSHGSRAHKSTSSWSCIKWWKKASAMDHSCVRVR